MYKLTVLSPQTDELMCLFFFASSLLTLGGRGPGGVALKDGVALKMKIQSLSSRPRADGKSGEVHKVHKTSTGGDGD